MGQSVKIFVNYHKPFDLLQSASIQPIHVGRSIAQTPSKDDTVDDDSLQWLIENAIGDDTGENISHKNRNYNELTGIYWAWKNYNDIGNPDYIGFMQYRRHFIFNETRFDEYVPRNTDELAYAKINVGTIYEGYERDFGLDDKTIGKYMQKYDCILPKPCDLSPYVDSIKLDYTQRIEGTKAKDLKILASAVKKVAPEYYGILRERLRATDKRCYQSFVLKKELFFEYCEFLFGVLDEVEKHIDVSGYSINGQRTLGYLGEILFDTYFFQFTTKRTAPYVELGMTFLCANKPQQSSKGKTAIVLLAYSDFESLELSLAVYSKFLKKDTKLFVLQNGRGTYDTERTYRVAKRYADLFPLNIEVVDDIAPQKPYWAIKELLESKRMAPYEYVCKVDDDAFPLTQDWLERLCDLYDKEFEKNGDNIAYVSALVNNNPFGFKQLIDRNEMLSNEYYSTIARTHFTGTRGKLKGYAKQTLNTADIINDDVNGTIWGYPYISRWLHEKTTLKPDDYIAMTQSYPDVYVGDKRYSINCMLFPKGYWSQIADSASEFPDDDEYLSEQYCKRNGKLVPVRLSIPFAHLYFFIQREENRDMIVQFRNVYERWLGHPFPIALQVEKHFENENRLRYIEGVAHAVHGHTSIARKPNIKQRIKSNRFVKKAWRSMPVSVRHKIRQVKHNVRL